LTISRLSRDRHIFVQGTIKYRKFSFCEWANIRHWGELILFTHNCVSDLGQSYGDSMADKLILGK
jgi:hypothetical protein